MSDEAHLSAEQSGPRTAARLPSPDVDSGRAHRDPQSPRARTEQAVGLTSITKRRDFLAANSARRAGAPGFVLLLRDRSDGDPAKRLGITVTRKIGNAVVRNRMKRRFRALAREVIAPSGPAGCDHVLIGRADGIERPYARLRDELARALAKVST